MTTKKRKVEVFSAGCPVCDETITLVNRIALQSKERAGAASYCNVFKLPASF